MDLNNTHTMDPNILLGIVNEKLRHGCRDMNDLTTELDIESNQLQSKMAAIGYHYNPVNNQFTSESLA